MKITTQLHINRLIEIFPTCILDLIKSFLFYDIETYKIMQIAKLNKKKVFYIINNVNLSRANNFDNDPYYSNDDEHWCFGCYSNSLLNEKIRMQAVNCYFCGNYLYHSGDNELYSDNIYCKCNIDYIYSDYSSEYNSIDDELSDYISDDDSIEDEITFYMNSLLIN